MNSLGERIAHYRKKSGLTQEQLAEKCAVTSQAVSKWENGLTAPDVTLIAPLASLFGITCDELLGVRRKEVSLIDRELVDISKMLLKVKINSEDGDVVNVNLPLSIADVVLKSGIVKFGENGDVLKGIDVEQIVSLIKLGAVGKLVDIKSKDGATVEVWVE